jgi:hypothetical protein
MRGEWIRGWPQIETRELSAAVSDGWESRPERARSAKHGVVEIPPGLRTRSPTVSAKFPRAAARGWVFRFWPLLRICYFR